VSTEFPPGPGGIGTQAFQLARSLSELGWRVAVLSPQDYAPDKEIQRLNTSQSFRIVRQQHHTSRMLEGMGRFWSLVRLSMDFQPDILLASGARSVYQAAVYSEFSGRPWVAVAHGGKEFGALRPWVCLVNRWAYSNADVVVCVSNFARRRMLDFGVNAPRVEVITNGADAHLFRPLAPEVPQELRRKWKLERAWIILTVGRLAKRKGQEIVIRALPRVLEGHPEVHYVMIGLPQIQTQLEQIAKDLDVLPHVHFLGTVDDATLVSAYNACDLFAMTSLQQMDGDAEGYGIAVLEAALCGKPAVVSGESGLAEAVIHDQTGLLVPENDPEAVAEAILRMLGDDTARYWMGQQAREHALNRQTWTSRAELYDRVLKKTLAEG
jgi:phosphatidylinositol alpha-1,6-mannosyltransferase